MNAWELLRKLHTNCYFQSIERGYGRASNSELKRWIENGALEINGEKVRWNEPMDFTIDSVVLFPKKRRTTLY